jgi:hypothetical protein
MKQTASSSVSPFSPEHVLGGTYSLLTPQVWCINHSRAYWTYIVVLQTSDPVLFCFQGRCRYRAGSTNANSLYLLIKELAS